VGKSIFKDLSALKRVRIDKVHKDAISSLNLVYDEETKLQRVVTTSLDGFIKMIDVKDATVKKAFFVCQSGITCATTLSSQDSFAVSQLSHSLSLACSSEPQHIRVQLSDGHDDHQLLRSR